MLLAIREKARGWVAWVVIILIGAAFALFGLSSYFGPSGEGQIAATVNGVDIPRQFVDREYSSARLELERLRGSALSLEEERMLRLQTLDSLINQQVLAQYVSERGLRISDSDLAGLIARIDEFQTNGRFDRLRYQAFAARQGTTPAGLEARLRQDLLLQTLIDAVSETSVISEREVDHLLALDQQRRALRVLVVDAEAFGDGIVIDAEAERAYYAANRERFRSPEQVMLEYLLLDRDAVRGRVAVSETDLRDRYRLVVEAETEAERREASHILLRLRADADAATVAEAEARAAGIAAELAAGEAFEALAERESDDRASAARGGALGAVSRGVYGEVFDQALFAIDAEGAVVGPVRGEFGLHFIRLDQAPDAGATPSFEALRERLRADLIEERLGEALFEAQGALGDLVFDVPDSLEPAAAAMGLALERSPWLGRGERPPGVLAHPDVVRSMFSDAVLRARENSDVINLGGDRYLVLRVLDHRPAEGLEFERVQAEISALLRAERAAQAAAEHARSLRAAWAAGEDLELLAEAHPGVSLDTPGLIGRGEPGYAPALLREAFRMPRPAAGSSSARVVDLGGGRHALVLVDSVVDGDPGTLEPEERAAVGRELRRQAAQEAIDGFLIALRARAEVEIRGR